MDIGLLVKGIENVREVIEVHEVGSLNDPNNITLVTAIKSSGEEASYVIYGKGNKPRVGDKYAAALLELHICRNGCYLNSDQSTYSDRAIY